MKPINRLAAVVTTLLEPAIASGLIPKDALLAEVRKALDAQTNTKN